MLGSAQTVYMSECIYCRDTQSENGSVTDLQLLQGEERVEGGASFPQPHQFIIEGPLCSRALAAVIG